MTDKKFYWHTAFMITNNYPESVRKLRKKADKYGINTRDAYGTTVFDSIHNSNYSKQLSDIIFEYDPVLPTLSNGYFELRSSLSMNNDYILKKFLERDTEYHYIRCRYKYNYIYMFKNFMCYYYSDMFVCYKYLETFVNHFHRGITFFELMKFRTLDKKKIVLIENVEYKTMVMSR